MKFYTIAVSSILLSLAIVACDSDRSQTTRDTVKKTTERPIWAPSDSLRYFALKDSAKLKHIKSQFYLGPKGRLFEKMDAPKDALEVDAGIVTFFRLTNQDIDPLSFEVIDESWFAKDKKHVYNYRSTDSGMFCITMDEADVRTFRVLPGDNAVYGADDKHVFYENDIINHLDPKKMRVITDKESGLVKIISGRYVYNASSGSRDAVLIKKK